MFSERLRVNPPKLRPRALQICYFSCSSTVLIPIAGMYTQVTSSLVLPMVPATEGGILARTPHFERPSLFVIRHPAAYLWPAVLQIAFQLNWNGQ